VSWLLSAALRLSGLSDNSLCPFLDSVGVLLWSECCALSTALLYCTALLILHCLLSTALLACVPLCGLSALALHCRSHITRANVRRTLFCVAHPTAASRWSAFVAQCPQFVLPRQSYVAALICFKRLNLPQLPADLRRLLWSTYVRDVEFRVWTKCKIKIGMISKWIADDDIYKERNAIFAIDGTYRMRILCIRDKGSLACVVDGTGIQQFQQFIHDVFVLVSDTCKVRMRVYFLTSECRKEIALYRGHLAKHGAFVQ
jgi:hypothetical protein